MMLDVRSDSPEIPLRIDGSHDLLLRAQPGVVPSFLRSGFAVRPIPDEIHELLLHRRGDLVAAALEWLQGELEVWCGVPLDPFSAEGPRAFRRGAVMEARLDAIEGEIISAILCIDQDTEAPWPIVLRDGSGASSEIVLASGEMLLYEGARLAQSRPAPLCGKSWLELVLHYRPAGWASQLSDLRARLESSVHRLELAALRAFAPPIVELLGACLSGRDCARLIELAGSQLAALGTVGVSDHEIHRSRVGEGTWVHGPDPVLDRVEALVSRLTGRPISHQETLHVIRYGEGGRYLPHYDVFDEEAPGGRRALELAGQRTDTVLFYLDEGCEGGETVFPRLGLVVRPGRGHAVRWRNTWRGERLDETLHEGLPVLRGEKWVATAWVRERPFRR